MMPDVVHTVKRVPLDWTLSAEQGALLVRADSRPFALVGRWAGGGAVIGSEPTAVADADEDPFALLDEQPLLAAPGALAVAGGWFGYLGYGLGRRLEPVGPAPPISGALPDFQLGFYDHVLRLVADGRWWFEALWSEAGAERLEARLDDLRARAQAPPQPRSFETEPWRATPHEAGHRLAVASCRERIHEGDLFQANLCVRLQSRISGDPLDLFLAALRELRPDRGAYLSGPWGAIASVSPELFLERHAGRVRSAPIKGTIRMPDDPRAAHEAREALRGSAKDRAENVMIVDLVRNDLGRVCQSGSVEVDEFAQPRAHTGVWHLVSEVSGALRPGTSDAELVRAAFPPGSVTGAPKVAALNVIAELESTARGVYTGAIGFASATTGLELNVAIRTFEFRGDMAWLGVGGGIVADSDPEAEAAECVTKAEPLLRAIGAHLDAPPRHPDEPQTPGPLRRAPRPTPRPDPAAGIFETLLVRDGQPLALDEHLARLADSLRELYTLELPASLAERMMLRSAGLRHARLRVNARPGDGAPQIDIEVSRVPERPQPATLEPVTLPGGIGAHKWIDRRLLDALANATAGWEALLCDLDGLVLETPRANVFVVTRDGALLTPPADGRILPGITRAQVLEIAVSHGLETQVRPVELHEVQAAAELFLTGSLAGVEPCRMSGSSALNRPPQVTEQLRTNLYKSAPHVILR